MYTMIVDFKALRISLGFSQVKLAHESKVSLPTIQNIEANKANPTIDVLEKLAIALGLELKFQPIPFDIERAIALGVPLINTTSPSRIIVVNATSLKNEARKWHHTLKLNALKEREEMALISFLTAMKDHYPTFYQNEIVCPLFEKKIKEMRSSGKVIKLRRMALSNLSKYL
jgi:transcriptional regulator with XRE-family HTH domain